MDPQIVAAVIAVGVPVIVAALTQLVRRRPKPAGGLAFVQVTLEASRTTYWREVEVTPLSRRDQGDGHWSGQVSMWNRPDPFGRSYDQHFSLKDFRYLTDPAFDITLQNTGRAALILTQVGVEVVSIAHKFYKYGVPQAVPIPVGGAYTIDMPDLKSVIYSHASFPTSASLSKVEGVAPIEINRVVPGHVSPIHLEPGAPYRYTLLLEGYCRSMPNGSILRMWVRSDKGEKRSHEIYLFTL